MYLRPKRPREDGNDKGGGGHKCACKDKNRLTCITFRAPNASQATLSGTVNNAGSFYEFNFPNSFSVHRSKPCTIQVSNASIAYNTNHSAYTAYAAAIDIVTDIPVQGLAMNLPYYPDGQVVQAPIDIGTGVETDGITYVQNNSLLSTNGTTNNNAFVAFTHKVFTCTQPNPTKFRCQALPDRIKVYMLHTAFGSTTPTQHAPNHLSLTLEIEFDE